MPTLNNMKQLEAYVNKMIKDSIVDDVSKTVISRVEDHVQTDVYDAYPNPVMYERTGTLARSFKSTPTANGVEIQSTYVDDGRDVAEVVEYGHYESSQGYEYPSEGKAYMKPRPFIENTRQELRDTKIHVTELERSLNKKGINTKL